MKKSNILLTATLLGTITLGGALPVNAVDESKSTLTFKEKDSVVKPVDPENPSEPEDPDNPVTTDPENPNPDNPNIPTGNQGPLSLDVVPGTMNFGTQYVDLKGGTYYAEGNTGAKHFLQVTDNRSDENGWDIKVSRTIFNDTTDNAKNLVAELVLPAERTVRNSLTADPTALAPDFLTSATEFSIPVGADNASTLISTGTSTDPLHGKETSTYTWEQAGEKLVVGKGAAKTGNYSSTINWTLSASADN